MHPTDYRFVPGHQAPNEKSENEPLLFLFQHQRIVISAQSPSMLPGPAVLEQLDVTFDTFHFFGHWEGRPCYATHLPNTRQELDGYEWSRLRNLYGDGDLFWVAGRGHHLAHWHATHQFCGRCGTPMQVTGEELARSCPSCQHTVYPRISPAVIMAVTDQDKILLGKISRPGINMHSVLAGFVEPGESLEGCVAREVMEETGLRVKNIQYFGSQPWAFPDQLMVGFTAEYAGGEIVLDDELEEADWFTADQLPNIPPKPSIARGLIDWFCEQQGYELPADYKR